MIIIGLSIAGIILFVLGISFLFRGFVSSPDADSVVPLDDFLSTKEILETIKNSEQRAKEELDQTKIELDAVRKSFELTHNKEKEIQEELEKVRAQSRESVGASESQILEYASQIENLKKEKDQLACTSQQERQKLAELKVKMEMLQKKVVEQAEGALEVIDQIAKEQETAGIDEGQSEELVEQLDQLAVRGDEQKEKVAELKGRVDEVQSKVLDQAKEALTVIEQLTAENMELKAEGEKGKMMVEQLEDQLSCLAKESGEFQNDADYENKIQKMEKELLKFKEKNDRRVNESSVLIDRLKSEKDSYKVALQKNARKIEQLQEELSHSRQKSQEDIVNLGGLVEGMKVENETLRLKENECISRISSMEKELGSIHDQYRAQLEDARNQVDLLQDEKGVAKTSKNEQDELVRLKAFIEDLSQKEQSIQYELARKTAQATTLEKICADYKTKLEEFEKNQAKP